MAMERLGDPNEVIERWDRVFRALASEPRRQLLTSLNDLPAGCDVALPEGAMSPRAPMDPESLRTELYHSHLPLLADGGYVAWDDEPLTARRGPNFREVAVVFDALYETANRIPDQLVLGCQRLENERDRDANGST